MNPEKMRELASRMVVMIHNRPVINIDDDLAMELANALNYAADEIERLKAHAAETLSLRIDDAAALREARAEVERLTSLIAEVRADAKAEAKIAALRIGQLEKDERIRARQREEDRRCGT